LNNPLEGSGAALQDPVFSKNLLLFPVDVL